MWKQHLAAYIAAERQHHAAERIMARAERVLDRLLEHDVDENRAYMLAGVALADVRSLRAYQEMSRAGELLKSSLQNESTAIRLLARGAWLCAKRRRKVQP
jgi:hypothetical protein